MDTIAYRGLDEHKATVLSQLPKVAAMARFAKSGFSRTVLRLS